MKAPQAPRQAAGFSMTPMIDVVFLLIIFFLVASHFTNQENAVEVDLPKADEAKELPPEETPRLTVTLPDETQIFIGMKPIAAADLLEILTREKAQHKEGFQLRIRAGRKVPYSAVEPILLQAAEAGIYDVQFAVMEEGI